MAKVTGPSSLLSSTPASGVDWSTETDAVLLRGALSPWNFILLVAVGVMGTAATILAIIGVALLG